MCPKFSFIKKKHQNVRCAQGQGVQKTPQGSLEHNINCTHTWCAEAEMESAASRAPATKSASAGHRGENKGEVGAVVKEWRKEQTKGEPR